MIKKVHHKAVLVIEEYGKMLGLDLSYFVKNGFWVLVRQAITILSGIIISIIFVRYSDKVTFGQYNFVLAIFSLASVLSIPGLNIAIVRSVAKGNDGDYKKAVKKSFYWSLVGIPVLMGIGLIYIFKNENILGLSFLIAAIFFPLFYAPNSWDSFLQGKHKFDILAKYGAILATANTIITVNVIFFFGTNLLAILLAYFASYSFFNLYYYSKSIKYIENEKQAVDTIDYGFSITKISTVGSIIDSLDKVVIGIFNLQVLAVYALALNLNENIKNLIKSISSVVFPKLAKNNYKFTAVNKIFIFILSFGFSLVLYLLSDSIFKVLYTDKFLESAKIFRYLVFVIPFFVLNSFLNYQVLAGKKENIIFKTNVISPIITILAALPSIFYGNILFYILIKVYLKNIINSYYYLKS